MGLEVLHTMFVALRLARTIFSLGLGIYHLKNVWGDLTARIH